MASMECSETSCHQYSRMRILPMRRDDCGRASWPDFAMPKSRRRTEAEEVLFLPTETAKPHRSQRQDASHGFPGTQIFILSILVLVYSFQSMDIAAAAGSSLVTGNFGARSVSRSLLVLPRSSEKSIASRKILWIPHKNAANFANLLQSLRGGSSDDDDQDESEDDEEMPLMESDADDEEEEEDDDDDMVLGLDDEDFLLAGDALDSGDFQEETVVDRVVAAFSKTPPFTKMYMTASFVATLCGFVFNKNEFPKILSLEWRAVLTRLQVWRLITAFFNFGPFGLSYLMTSHFVWTYMSTLERLNHARPYNFWCMIFFGQFCMLVGYPLLKLSPKFLGHNLSTFLVYIWSRYHEGLEVNMFELFNTKAELLPWFFLAQTF
jgi:Der1-like family